MINGQRIIGEGHISLQGVGKRNGLAEDSKNMFVLSEEDAKFVAKSHLEPSWACQPYWVPVFILNCLASTTMPIQQTHPKPWPSLLLFAFCLTGTALFSSVKPSLAVLGTVLYYRLNGYVRILFIKYFTCGGISLIRPATRPTQTGSMASHPLSSVPVLYNRLN